MKKENRRVKLTKLLLRNTLLTLMKDTPVDKITITTLCEEDDINRSTFYLHYQGVGDLLRSIEKEFYNSIREKIKTNDLIHPQQDMLNSIFEIIYENREVYAALLGKNGNEDFLRSILTISSDKVLRQWGESGINPDDLEYVYNFYIQGCVGLVGHWASRNFKETPQEIANLFARLLNALINGMTAADK